MASRAFRGDATGPRECAPDAPDNLEIPGSPLKRRPE
jgi:hypothetical protein